MKRLRKPASIRSTLLSTFLLAVLICFAVGLFNYLSTRLMLAEMTTYVTASRKLSAIQTNIQTVQDETDLYLFSRSTESLQRYYDGFNSVQSNAEDLLRGVEYTKTGIKLKNLAGMLRHYLQSSDATIVAKRNEKTDEYASYYQNMTTEYRYISAYIQNILTADLQESALQYDNMQASIQQRTVLSYFLFVVSIVLVVALVATLSHKVATPITRLAEYADNVAQGDYTVTIGKDDSSSELSRLYSAFNIMILNTRLYLHGLSEKQALESELAQQRIKGLETDNALKQARLLALHAQMNPHFIFNTINIGAKLAMLQGDDMLCDYLENAADVFRYNLEGLDEATLAEELSNVDAYMRLLTTRFGDKLRYSQYLDASVDTRQCRLPRMTLQPLVENAFLHGVAPCETGGIIRVEATTKDGNVLIVIANTGQRFPQRSIDALYKETPPPDSGGHASGIGLGNVIKRLQLCFQTQRPLAVIFENGETRVTLTLPSAPPEKL